MGVWPRLKTEIHFHKSESDSTSSSAAADFNLVIISILDLRFFNLEYKNLKPNCGKCFQYSLKRNNRIRQRGTLNSYLKKRDNVWTADDVNSFGTF